MRHTLNVEVRCTGNGDITTETPFVCCAVASAAQAPAAGAHLHINSRCLSLPAQPAENSLKMLVNAPILFICDSN